MFSLTPLVTLPHLFLGLRRFAKLRKDRRRLGFTRHENVHSVNLRLAADNHQHTTRINLLELFKELLREGGADDIDLGARRKNVELLRDIISRRLFHIPTLVTDDPSLLNMIAVRGGEQKLNRELLALMHETVSDERDRRVERLPRVTEHLESDVVGRRLGETNHESVFATLMTKERGRDDVPAELVRLDDLDPNGPCVGGRLNCGLLHTLATHGSHLLRHRPLLSALRRVLVVNKNLDELPNSQAQASKEARA